MRKLLYYPIVSMFLFFISCGANFIESKGADSIKDSIKADSINKDSTNKDSKQIILAKNTSYNTESSDLESNQTQSQYVESKQDSEQIKQDLEMINAAMLLNQMEYDKAIEIYENLYDKTKDPHFLKQIAMVKAQSGNLESALEYAKKYQDLSKDSNDLETSLIIAESYIRQGEFANAAALLERANDKNESVQTHYILSNLYMQLGEPTKALPHLLEVYNNDMIGEKIRTEALYNILGIYFSQNEIDKAFEILNKYISNPEFKENIQEYAGAYLQYNRLNDLKESLKARFSADSNIENLRYLVATLLELKENKEAIDIIKENIALLGNDARVLLMHLYANSNDYKNAYSVAKELYDSTKEVEYLGLKTIYEFEIMPNKSRNSLDSIIKNLKYVIEQRVNERKRDNENLNAQDAFYYNFLGYLLIDYDIDIKNGLDYVSKALSIVPNSAEYLDSLAWGFYKSKECSKAKETIDLIPQSQIQDTDEIQKHYNAIQQRCVK